MIERVNKEIRPHTSFCTRIRKTKFNIFELYFHASDLSTSKLAYLTRNFIRDSSIIA